jgi:AcrR family transcriptional regulator
MVDGTRRVVTKELEADAPRGRPRDEAREQAILDAAIALVAEIGYDAMSMEAVASRAGVSKATIYRRWNGKAELIADAIGRMHPQDEFADPDDTGSLRGDLMALISTMFAKISGIDGGLFCGLAVAMRADSDLGRLLDEGKRDYHERIQRLIVSRAQARGELPGSAEPPQLMDVVVGVSLLHLMSGRPLDSEFADYLVDRVLMPLLRS